MNRLSGITPSGHVHLGNHLGAVRRWAREGSAEDLYFVSDMHAMTTPYSPQRLRALTREQLAVLIAAGVPGESVFVQSDLLREHAALTWILECVGTFGEARRMTQFKEKSENATSVRLGLLTYPVLMAADILAHGAAEVPVGEDQLQHVELARVLARRFNESYGQAFVVPRPVLPVAAARVRDLADPSRKMAKSTRDEAGVLRVLDPPDVLRRKVSGAVTDSVGEIRHAPDSQPGVANLLEILGACTGRSATAAAAGLSGYAALKSAVADAVIEELRPVRERTVELLEDPAELDRIRQAGAKRARDRAQPTLDAAIRLAGLG
jgi:tryptophanyl-tRNA synthetase